MAEGAIEARAARPGLLARYAHLNLALSDQAMVSGVNFCTNLLLARHLGIHEFGRFTLAWMAVLVAASVQEALIISPMMSIGPTVPPGETPRYFATVMSHQAVWASMAFCLLLAGVAISGGIVSSWNMEGLALPLATAAAAHLLQEFARRYFYTRGRARTAFAIDAMAYFGRLGTLLVLFRIGTVTTATALWVVAAAATAAFATGLVQFEPVRFERATMIRVTLRHWRFARWLGASVIMFWACNNFFIVSAGAILGAWAVGAIKAAQDIMGVTNILYQGLYNVVIVRAASQLATGGAVALKRYLRQVAFWGALAVAGIGLVASVAPGFWLRLFYGEQYAGYGHLVQWYAAAYLMGFLHVPMRAGLYVTERTLAVFAGYTVVAAFSVLAAYPMIRTFGLNGAMAGPLIAEIIMCGVLYGVLRKTLSHPSTAAGSSAGAAPRS